VCGRRWWLGGSWGGAVDLIERLLELRQSSSGAVVSEAGYSELQERMHVPDGIEDWIFERIETWRSEGSVRPLLVMLSGNAGDGKSDLISRLRRRLGDPEDVDVIADATHAETPSEDQMARLAAFFSPFADEADPPENPSVALIAMNTGMALSFLQTTRDEDYGLRFALLERVIKRELGLSSEEAEPSWESEIINLDRRRLLPFDDQPALFYGMLDKLDPHDEDGILFEAGRPCETCSARHVCFVRTNVEMLRTEDVRQNLTDLLWAASLGGDVHLSPRSMWDFLYRVTTGGADFFEREESPCAAIEALAEDPIGSAPAIQARLLHNLLFEPPEDGSPSRGPIFDALAAADPIQRVGRNGHQAESAVFNDVAADANAMLEAARIVAGSEPDGGDDPVFDPCLEHLSTLLGERAAWDSESERMQLARGVARRAKVIGAPGSVAGELIDSELVDYSALLTAYGRWTEGSPAADEIRQFARDMVRAIQRIFGVAVGGNSYFRQDSFSPASRFPAYAPIDLADAIQPIRDDDISRGATWLGALNYRPRAVTVVVRAGGAQPWRIRADLALYRLFQRVLRGYAASSVDLESFFGLRFACERLGSSDPDAKEMMIRDVDGGRVYRIRERLELDAQVLEFEEIGA
jgi:hypothetical protein